MLGSVFLIQNSIISIFMTECSFLKYSLMAEILHQLNYATLIWYNLFNLVLTLGHQNCFQFLTIITNYVVRLFTHIFVRIFHYFLQIGIVYLVLWIFLTQYLIPIIVCNVQHDICCQITRQKIFVSFYLKITEILLILQVTTFKITANVIRRNDTASY